MSNSMYSFLLNSTLYISVLMSSYMCPPIIDVMHSFKSTWFVHPNHAHMPIVCTRLFFSSPLRAWVQHYYIEYRWTTLSEIMYAALDLMIFIGTLEIFFLCPSSVLHERTRVGYNFRSTGIVPSNIHCDEIHLREKVSELGNCLDHWWLLVLSD